LKAQPLRLVDGKYSQCGPAEATHVRLNMPGPLPDRFIPVQLGGKRAGTGNWTWNGDVDEPTLRPSILTSSGEAGHRCHTWVNEGQAQFLGDCSHDLKGQTVPLLEVIEGYYCFHDAEDDDEE